MDPNQHNADQGFLTYIRVLQEESTFKAKVLYSLRCICNSLTDTTRNCNTHYLAHHQSLLVHIADLYPETTIQELLTTILLHLQASG